MSWTYGICIGIRRQRLILFIIVIHRKCKISMKELAKTMTRMAIDNDENKRSPPPISMVETFQLYVNLITVAQISND